MKRKPSPPRIDIITLFPEMFAGPLDYGIVGRARRNGLLEISFTNPREFAEGRHKTVDDRPYGGGRGMVMMAPPLDRAIRKVRRGDSLVIYLSPQGRPLRQPLAKELARKRRLVLLCGHYEGVDQRVLERVDMEISIGDYVLTGGELPAMVLVDAVARLLPGVLSEEATGLESFSREELEHPQFTRPRVWRGRRVPEALLSGDHARIERWRLRRSRAVTRLKRPDLAASSGSPYPYRYRRPLKHPKSRRAS